MKAVVTGGVFWEHRYDTRVAAGSIIDEYHDGDVTRVSHVRFCDIEVRIDAEQFGEKRRNETGMVSTEGLQSSAEGRRDRGDKQNRLA